MDDDLTRILRMVAEGELSPDEAEPLVAALSGTREPTDTETPRDPGPGPRPMTEDRDRGAGPRIMTEEELSPRAAGRPDRQLRLQVVEHGRSVVNLRIPLSLARMAGSMVPGLSGAHAERIQEAIRSGTVGRIIEVQDEDGDGVIISTE
jgi:hypothetical protein